MKFDDWMLARDKSYVPTDDSKSLRLLRECWFSRDAEVAELKAEVEEESALRERLAKLLAETAIALKGEEAALTKHSWNDLGWCAAVVVRERDKLREQVMLLRDALRHLWNERTPDSYDEAGEALAATERHDRS